MREENLFERTAISIMGEFNLERFKRDQPTLFESIIATIKISNSGQDRQIRDLLNQLNGIVGRNELSNVLDDEKVRYEEIDGKKTMIIQSKMNF